LNQNDYCNNMINRIGKKIRREISNMGYRLLDSYSDYDKFNFIIVTSGMIKELLDYEEANTKLLDALKKSSINGTDAEKKFDVFNLIRNLSHHFIFLIAGMKFFSLLMG